MSEVQNSTRTTSSSCSPPNTSSRMQSFIGRRTKKTATKIENEKNLFLNHGQNQNIFGGSDLF